MLRILFALTLVSVLAACEGRVEVDGTRTSVMPEQHSRSQTAGHSTGKNFFGDMQFDPVTGRLDLAMDSAQADATDPQPLIVPKGRYLAVFRKVVSRPGAGLVSFGLGAAPAQAQQASYVFTGEYALMRKVADDGRSARDMLYVARSEFAPVVLPALAQSTAVDGIGLDFNYLNANDIEAPEQGGAMTVISATQLRFDSWRLQGNTQSLATVQDWDALLQGPYGVPVEGAMLVSGDGPIGIDAQTGDYVLVPSWGRDRRLASR
jgi:hypothetical protein